MAAVSLYVNGLCNLSSPRQLQYITYYSEFVFLSVISIPFKLDTMQRAIGKRVPSKTQFRLQSQPLASRSLRASYTVPHGRVLKQCKMCQEQIGFNFLWTLRVRSWWRWCLRSKDINWSGAWRRRWMYIQRNTRQNVIILMYGWPCIVVQCG